MQCMCDILQHMYEIGVVSACLPSGQLSLAVAVSRGATDVRQPRNHGRCTCECCVGSGSCLEACLKPNELEDRCAGQV